MSQPRIKNKKIAVAKDPESKFRHGAAFVHAAGIISNQTATKFHLWAPTIVCRALAFELLLKSLIELENGTYDRSHNLAELFQRLSLVSRENIKARSIAKAKTLEPEDERWQNFDPEIALKKSSEAFVNFRYMFEPEKMVKAFWLADPLLMAIPQRILDLRPDWFDIGNDPSAPLSRPPSPIP